jgi:hypothetical protein
MSLSFAGMILLAVLGLACVGVVVAVALAVANISNRKMRHPEQAMRCHHCGAKVSPIDRHCPACGHAMKPQGIEKLDPDAR